MNVIAKKQVNVITPNPPICIRIRIIIIPIGVKVVGISTVLNPVTHVALVDTKSASINGKPLYVERGNISIPAPMNIMMKKLTENTKD